MAVAKIGVLPGYVKAVKNYTAPPAVVKAIAPTKPAKIALGPKFGSPLPAGSQPIPNYMLPAVPPTNQTTPDSTGGTVPVPRSAVPSNYIPSLADITGNPLSESALGQYNTNMQSFMRALRSGIGQQVIKSGYDPTAAFQKLMADRPDLGQFGDLLDPTAAATAAQNPLSERALNEQAYTRGMSNLDYELAARGIGGSGAQATGGNQLTQTRQLAENQSRDALLNAIQGGMTDYLGKQTSGYTDLMNTYAQVAQQLAQQPGAVYDEGTNTVQDEENAAAAAGTGGLVPGTNIPNAASKPVNGIAWGGSTIHNVNEMRQWLGARGQRWDVWAPQHPALARQLLDLS